MWFSCQNTNAKRGLEISEMKNEDSVLLNTHMEAFEEGQFVIYMQDCVSAVDHIKGIFRERPLSGIGHLKLDLR